MSAIDFLRAELLTDDLEAALRVLRAFKALETQEEWLIRPFSTWAMLELLEEYLVFLVEGGQLDEDTVRVAKAAGIELVSRRRKPKEEST